MQDAKIARKVMFLLTLIPIPIYATDWMSRVPGALRAQPTSCLLTVLLPPHIPARNSVPSWTVFDMEHMMPMVNCPSIAPLASDRLQTTKSGSWSYPCQFAVSWRFILATSITPSLICWLSHWVTPTCCHPQNIDAVPIVQEPGEKVEDGAASRWTTTRMRMKTLRSKRKRSQWHERAERSSGPTGTGSIQLIRFHC